MKLEAGQVWRRPDGTTWKVLAPFEGKDVCMKQLTFLERKGELAPRITDAWQVYPQLVITETWKLAPHNPSFIHTEPDKLEDEGT